MSETPRYDHVQTIETMIDALRQFAVMSSLVPDSAVRQAREAVSMADSIGHILDPTKYRDAIYSGSLDRQKRVVDLFARTVRDLQGIFPDVAALRAIGDADV